MTHKNRNKKAHYPRLPRPMVPEMVEARTGKKFEVHLCVGGETRPTFYVEVFDRASGQFLYRFAYPAHMYEVARDKMIFIAQVR